MYDDFISYDLERKRNAYQSQEKEICKDCEDRAGLPCLFVFDCDKLKQAERDKAVEDLQKLISRLRGKCNFCKNSDDKTIKVYQCGTIIRVDIKELRGEGTTNYERIKGVSVEEMARSQSTLFCQACKAEKPTKCKKEGFVNGLSPCGQCVLKWLNSEVEE